MARIRSIKPDYFRSPKIASLPYEARWMFAGMWTECDDEGRMPCGARLFAGLFFGGDTKATDRKIEAWIKLLARKELIVLYDVEGVRYSAVKNWREHQRINKPQPAKYPAPPPDRLFDPDGSRTDSGSDSGNGSRTDSARGKERKGKEVDLGLVATGLGSGTEASDETDGTNGDGSNITPADRHRLAHENMGIRDPEHCDLCKRGEEAG